MAVPSSAVKKERVLMAVPSQAVGKTERAVKRGTSWDFMKLHFTIDKIIVFFVIAFLWMFSTVPLFIFYTTPSGQVRGVYINVTGTMNSYLYQMKLVPGIS